MKKTLREWRISSGYDTLYVSNLLGIKRQSLTSKERNNRFRALEVKTLCELYGINIEQVEI